MKTERYDYAVFFFTPKADPVCHFYFSDLKDVQIMEDLWETRGFAAYVVSIRDTHTGQVIYERAEA